MPLFPAQRQADPREFNTTWVYRVGSRTIRATQKHCLKIKMFLIKNIRNPNLNKITHQSSSAHLLVLCSFLDFYWYNKKKDRVQNMITFFLYFSLLFQRYIGKFSRLNFRRISMISPSPKMNANDMGNQYFLRVKH